MGKNSSLLLALTCSILFSYYCLDKVRECSSEWSSLSGISSEYDVRLSSPLPNFPRRATTSRLRNGPLPYKCGVLFFYHIPSTGGSSINRWLKKYQKPEHGNYSYFQRWGKAVSREGIPNPDAESIEQLFNGRMNEYVQNLGKNEWRIAHSHLCNNYLNESDAILKNWRFAVESQGCEMINSVMLRDPLNHAMSLYKAISSKKSNKKEWISHLESTSGFGKWNTVLDFFLYNSHFLRFHDEYPIKIGRNPFNVTKEEKVRRALEILDLHFDVVTIGDHAEFKRQILNMTGWKDMDIPHANVYNNELTFTKKEVEALQKLLASNGDIDFTDMVKLRYQWPLSYLQDALSFRSNNQITEHEFLRDDEDDEEEDDNF